MLNFAVQLLELHVGIASQDSQISPRLVTHLYVKYNSRLFLEEYWKNNPSPLVLYHTYCKDPRIDQKKFSFILHVKMQVWLGYCSNLIEEEKIPLRAPRG